MNVRRQTMGEKFAVVFTIGIALSIASFVESLQVSRAAAQFVSEQFSHVRGLHDFVLVLAAALHGTLELWRGILRGLLGLLPFFIPEWLDDPISFVFFAVARAWSDGASYLREVRQKQ